MNKIEFKSHNNILYVVDTDTNIELGYIRDNAFTITNYVRITPDKLYEIADKLTGNPPREELFHAHSKLIRRQDTLRKRITEYVELLESIERYELSKKNIR